MFACSVRRVWVCYCCGWCCCRCFLWKQSKGSPLCSCASPLLHRHSLSPSPAFFRRNCPATLLHRLCFRFLFRVISYSDPHLTSLTHIHCTLGGSGEGQWKRGGDREKDVYVTLFSLPLAQTVDAVVVVRASLDSLLLSTASVAVVKSYWDGTVGRLVCVCVDSAAAVVQSCWRWQQEWRVGKER